MDKKNILLVEDDQDLSRLTAMALRANNYKVVLAQDAVTAVTKAQKEEPDLILLDIGIPGGDGFLVMNRLQLTPSLSKIPVVVISARDPAVNKDRALMTGARAYFQKPANNHELLTKISEILEA
jgi:DNA-binding response OmpR family regulator